MTAARYMALHKVARHGAALRDVCTRRITQTWRVTSWQFSDTSRDRPAVAGATTRRPDHSPARDDREAWPPSSTTPAAAESVRTSYPRKQSRNSTTSRRRLHVGVGVLRRSGWRLNAKMAERPPGNF
jgi:hypothetical protein